MSSLSTVERAQLAQAIESSILETIKKLGYRTGVAVQAVESAAKMVAARVQERNAKVKP